jgi:hypothetical protein
MHSRRPVMNLKPDSAPEPARVAEGEVIPLRRKREGFREDAEEYRRAGRQESLKAQDNVVVGLPKVGTFEASDSTFQEIAAKAA